MSKIGYKFMLKVVVATCIPRTSLSIPHTYSEAFTFSQETSPLIHKRSTEMDILCATGHDYLNDWLPITESREGFFPSSHFKRVKRI